MRLEKKTMATLITAVLIAMMGVMPALATQSDPVSLSATTRQEVYLSITATPTSITFPTTYIGKTVDGIGPDYEVFITITVAEGDEPVGYPLILSAVVSDDGPAFYTVGLALSVDNGGYVDYAEGSQLKSLEYGEVATVALQLTVPDGAVVGDHQGAIVFWLG